MLEILYGDEILLAREEVDDGGHWHSVERDLNDSFIGVNSKISGSGHGSVTKRVSNL